MALGYEGYVSLKVNAIEDVALGTGGGNPRARQRLESNSGYGGEISTPTNEMGIGFPRNYDWDVYDGSMDLELHEDFITNQIKPWIFDRQSAAEVFFQTRNGNAQRFLKSYWSNINLSASEGSALTSSISFVSMQRDTYTRGGDYIGNKTGTNGLCGATTEVYPDPLNSLGANINPIPYWNSSVEINLTQYDFTNWSIDLTQDVVKFFGCFGNSTVQEPKYVAVGPMSVIFTGDYMFTSAAGFSSPDTLTTLYVNMGGEQLKLEDLELTTDTDSLAGQGDIVPVSIEYAAYTLVA